VGRPALNPVVVLGATGSIGTQTLEVADRHNLTVAAIAAGAASESLVAIAQRHPDAQIAVAQPPTMPIDPSVEQRLACGPQAVADLARIPGATVINGIVGASGLAASLAALEAGNRLGLANKESLLIGGRLVIDALDAGGGQLIPIDSEHSAIWQCLAGEPADAVRRVVLTASGGPFHAKPDVDLARVSVVEALAHPTWDMGRRISIDSATLMNKAFEVIEAHLLFGLDYDQIDVVIHPQSYVHSFVEFVDGVVKAELGSPDMRKPIQYALGAPGRLPRAAAPFDVVGVDLTFAGPDRERFPALDLGYRAGRRGGNGPAVLNAADEIAVAAFLDEKIGFTEIVEVVADALEEVPFGPIDTLGSALAADAAGRDAARRFVAVRSVR
jgi:1-deoxy-D-xylulose-5-phosphate reductoisomerase